MFVTNTLGNPYDDEEWIPGILAPIAQSRKEANKIKRDEPITVVIGNPPYRERAKGSGGWVETATKNAKEPAPLAAWIPPKDWDAGAHAKHLRNLYIYFWRWATWKVFDHGPGSKSGIVCFITVAGFLSGPGFQRMREYLRRSCDDIWVIDCSPEGYQPGVNTRIFQAVQQPVCIVLASRSAKGNKGPEVPAKVLFQSLPAGHREHKFKALGQMRLNSAEWVECPSEWRAPFLPVSTGAWASYPQLEDFFIYNGAGVMPGRTWIIAPDSDSLLNRWNALITAPDEQKETLFHPHLRNGQPGDKHSNKVVPEGLPGFPARKQSVAAEIGDSNEPVRYAFRSFDRQWIIPDNRLINQPNPQLWKSRSDDQVYFTAFTEESPTSGPALTVAGLIPDLHHYKGSFGGRVIPLWRDQKATNSNFRPELLPFLSTKYGSTVSPEDLMAYIAAVAAYPAFTARFQSDLSTPGLRIPLTADHATFMEAAELGRRVIWLYTFGERMADPKNGRPESPPRVAGEKTPYIPAAGAIPDDPPDPDDSETLNRMPDHMDYDAGKHRLLVGEGYVENVPPQVWSYEISGKQVLPQWFSYRKRNRERPIIGERRTPSPLGDIQPDHWLPEYTTELINVLNVLALLVELEPAQAFLLEKICSGPLISEDELRAAGALELPPTPKKKKSKKQPGPKLFEHEEVGEE